MGFRHYLKPINIFLIHKVLTDLVFFFIPVYPTL